MGVEHSWKWILLLFVAAFAEAQDANCDYFQNVAAGTTYYVYSPNYPNNYTRGINCRWQAVCPVNQNCKLACTEINIPKTTNCVDDKILISTVGDPALTGANVYCGAGTLDVLSASNRLSIGLSSSRYTTAKTGRFLCSLTSQAGSITPAPVCRCGWKKQNRIVGGQETGVNEFPMMVALIDLSLRISYCGGTIIDKRWILTAAHCMDNQTPANVGILYGEHNMKTNDSPATTIIKVLAFRKPSQYTGQYEYDIGLMQTQVDIVFGDLVGPACLPFKYAQSQTLFTGATVSALGWGTTMFAGADSDYLRRVDLQVIDKASCQNVLGNVVTDRTLCTFTPGRDTCQHDSGGPLLYQEPSSGRIYLVGIIIGGYGCNANKPGLNTRVTEYLTWIESVTGNIFCKI